MNAADHWYSKSFQRQSIPFGVQILLYAVKIGQYQRFNGFQAFSESFQTWPMDAG